MDSLLIVLAALAPDTFFHHSFPKEASTKWQVSGEVNMQMTRKRGESKEGFLWVVQIENHNLEVLLSKDRSEMISAVQIHANGEKVVIPGANMWYSPLHRASKEQRSKSILSTDVMTKTAMGTFPCKTAMLKDDEGNIFRWTLSDDVIGGVVEYEVVFDGTPKRRLTYTLVEQEK